MVISNFHPLRLLLSPAVASFATMGTSSSEKRPRTFSIAPTKTMLKVNRGRFSDDDVADVAKLATAGLIQQQAQRMEVGYHHGDTRFNTNSMLVFFDELAKRVEKLKQSISGMGDESGKHMRKAGEAAAGLDKQIVSISKSLLGPRLVLRLVSLPLASRYLTMFREAMVGKKHVHADADNISIKPKRGTDRAYTLVRFKEEKPELYVSSLV